MKAKGSQKLGRNRMGPLQLSLRLFICAFAVLQIQHPNLVVNGQDDPDARKPVDVDKVTEFIKKYENEDMREFTYEQLENWFLEKSEKYRFKPYDYPRAFPFCITRNQIVQGHKDNPLFGDQSEENKNKPIRVPAQSKLIKFERYFHGVELRRKKFYQFDPQLDSTIHNRTFVKNITFHRINTPEADMVNLRQWVHIKVEMAEPMVGLYMQSIVGPLGLPFGEFSVEFDCSDGGDNVAKNISKVGELAYCSYRPKTNIYHPSAYVAFSEEPDTDSIEKPLQPKKRKNFHLHFKWFDLACMETPYVQFLMLIVKRETQNPKYGIDYVAQMSPVFLNTDFDSQDAYPYYPGFDKMFCFIEDNEGLTKKYKDNNIHQPGKSNADKLYEKIKWDESKEVIRIQPNEQYDDCILYDKKVHVNKTTERNEETYECGPGPFRCDMDYKDVKSTGHASVSDFRKTLVKNETIVSKCQPCGVPECTKIGFIPAYCKVELPPVNDLEVETNVLTDLDDNTRIRAHGVAGMLSFLVLIPVGHFVGRFYKEVMGKCLFGNGPWIFIHLMCSMLAIAAVWSSMGPMIPTLANIHHRQRVCKKLYDSTKHPDYETCLDGYHIKSAHTISGLIAYILVHLVPIFGFIRPPSNKLRFIMSALHSHLGYFTYFLGVVSVFLALQNPRCMDTFIFCVLLVVLPVVFSVIVFVMDLMSDKRIGVRPRRKQWPVLEHLQLESRGPLEYPKLIVLAVFLALMSITWLLALVSLHIVEDSGDKLLEGLNDFKGGKAKYLGKLQGLFGPCGKHSESSETKN